MRLSARIAEKIEESIQKLPILQVEKDAIDWEITAGKLDDPAGGPGMVTIYRLVLFAPVVGGQDHTTNDTPVIIWDPYLSQIQYDQMVAELYGEIVEEQETARSQDVPADLQTPKALSAVAQALSDARKSASGLYLPGR